MVSGQSIQPPGSPQFFTSRVKKVFFNHSVFKYSLVGHVDQTLFWTWDGVMAETDKVPFLVELTFWWVKSDNKQINMSCARC